LKPFVFEETSEGEIRFMKVLFVNSGLSRDADAPVMTTLRAQGMAEAGLDVVVMGYPEAMFPGAGQAGFQYISVLGRQNSLMKRLLRGLARLTGRLWPFILEPIIVESLSMGYARRLGCDVIFVASAEPWIILLVRFFRFGKAGRIPAVVRAANVYKRIPGPLGSRVRSWLNEFAIRHLPCSCIVCDSLHMYRAMDIGDSEYCIIPDGYSLSWKTGERGAARKALGLPAEGRALLLFGCASLAKGFDLLLEALEGVEPTFTVMIVGATGGVYADSWGNVDKLYDCGWRERLRVVSHRVSDDEMEMYFAACDVVALPYRSGSPTMSGNLRMAIDYGKAIIASDQYCLGEIVRDNQLGLLFPPGDVGALRQCLLEFASKHQVWFDQISDNSRKLRELLSWPEMGKLYRDLFEKVLRNHAQ
jgi:glycosyltransferase involved in cell wall biosynthesis